MDVSATYNNDYVTNHQIILKMETLHFQCELNNDLKYLKFWAQKEGFKVTLLDLQGYEILSGYGRTAIEALNDLHHNLI